MTSAPPETVTSDAPPPIGPPSAPLDEVSVAAGELRAVRDEVGDCRRCTLCARRQEVVFGWGHPAARVMFVGEAPGDGEDATAMPFVDAGGQLLTRMVHAMGLRRSDVYLAYVVMCRPPERAPSEEEVSTCLPFLRRQIERVRPEAIVAMGSLAARALTGRDAALARLQGSWGRFEGPDIPVMPTFPLEALVQNPRLKGAVWKDLRKVMRQLELPGRGRG